MAKSEQELKAEALDLFARFPERFTPEAASGDLNDEWTDLYNAVVGDGVEQSLALLDALDLSRCDEMQVAFLSAAFFEAMFDLYGNEHLDELTAAIDTTGEAGSISYLIAPTGLEAAASMRFYSWVQSTRRRRSRRGPDGIE